MKRNPAEFKNIMSYYNLDVIYVHLFIISSFYSFFYKPLSTFHVTIPFSPSFLDSIIFVKYFFLLLLQGSYNKVWANIATVDDSHPTNILFFSIAALRLPQPMIIIRYPAHISLKITSHNTFFPRSTQFLHISTASLVTN